MDLIKKFLVEHCEKILLAMIVLVCGWAFLKNMSVKQNTLSLPGGKSFEINKDSIDKNLAAIRDSLNNPEVVKKPEPIKQVYSEINRLFWQFQRPLEQTSLQWVAFASPLMPMRTAPIIVPDISAINDPEIYTQLSAPAKMQVRSGEGRAVILAESNYLKLINSADLEVLIQVRYIGFASEDLKLLARKMYRNSPNNITETTTPQPTPTKSPKEQPAQPNNNPWDIDTAPKRPDPVTPQPQTNVTSAPSTNVSTAIPRPSGAVSPETWVQAAKTHEESVSAALLNLMDKNQVAASGFVTLGKMLVLKTKPNEIQIQAMLRDGNIPSGLEAYDVKTVVESPPTLYFVFIHENVIDNSLYRYRLQLSAKAVMPAAANNNWDVRADLYDTGVVNTSVPIKALIPELGGSKPAGFNKNWEFKYFALTEAQMTAFNESESMLTSEKWSSLPYQVSGMTQPIFKTIERDVDTSFPENSTCRVLGIRNNETFLLTEFGRDMRNGRLYSTFTYSDIVLSVGGLNFELVRADLSNVAVRIEAILGDETRQQNFTINTLPQWRGEISDREFIDENGAERPLHLVYERAIRDKLGMIKDVGDKRRVGGKDWDFTTGYGILDVRPYLLKTTVMEKEGNDWRVRSTETSRTPRFYVVMVELKPRQGQQRKIVRLYQKPQAPQDSDTRKTEYEFIWYPSVSSGN